MSGKAVLICRQNSHPFQDRTLTLIQPVKIGRSVAQDRTALNNGIFDCKVLSRNHALFWYANGKFYLKDTKSSNGTFVNNQRMSKPGEESGPREVCSGDIVQFGVDVLENACKVTHGCIVATLKLFLPDGMEAKESPSTTVFNTISATPLEELHQLNQCIQSALRREEMLNTKLKSMKQTLEFCSLAADKGWKALIDEDKLLSRVESLENQLEVYSQLYSEDKSRQELLELHSAKATFEIILKDQFKKILDEKRRFHLKCKAAERTLLSAKMEISHLNTQIAVNQEELQVLAKKLFVEMAKVDELQHSLLQVQKKNNELQQRLSDETSKEAQGHISDMYLENEQNEKMFHSSSTKQTMQVPLQRLLVAIDEHKKFKDNIGHIIAQINLLQTDKMSILLQITDKENELIQLSIKHSRCQNETYTLGTALYYFEEGLRTVLLDSQKMETLSEIEITSVGRSDIRDVIPEKWNADPLQTQVNKLKDSLEHAQEKCRITDMKMYKVKLDIGAATDKLNETTDNCMHQHTVNPHTDKLNETTDNCMHQHTVNPHTDINETTDNCMQQHTVNQHTDKLNETTDNCTHQQKRLEEMQLLYEEKKRAILILKEQLEETVERSSKDTIEHVRNQIGEMYLESGQRENIFFYSSSIQHMMQVAIQRLSVSIEKHKKYKHIFEHVISHINILQDEKMSKLQELVDQEKECVQLCYDQSMYTNNIEFLSEKLIEFECFLKDAIWEAGETETCSPQPEVEIKMVLELQEWHLVPKPREWDTAQIQLYINKVKGSLEKERKTYMEKEIQIRTVKENISAIANKLEETTHNCDIQEKRLEEVKMLCEEKEKAVLALKEQLNKYLEILSNLLKNESNKVEENFKSSNNVTTEPDCKQDADVRLHKMLSLKDIKQTVLKRLLIFIDEQEKCKGIVDHIIGTIQNLEEQKHSTLQKIYEKQNEMADQPRITSRCVENKRIPNKNIINSVSLVKAKIIEFQKVDECSPESEDNIKTVVVTEKWDLDNVNKSKDSLESTKQFCTAGEMKNCKLNEDIGLIMNQLKEITDECTIQQKRLDEAHKLHEWKEKAVLHLKAELDFLETSLKEGARSNDTIEQLHRQLLDAQQLVKQSWNEAEQDRMIALSVKQEESELKQFLASQHNQFTLHAEESKIVEVKYCNQRLTSELDEKTIPSEHKLCLNSSQIEVCALEEELTLLKEKLSEMETSKAKLENNLHNMQENILSKNIVFVLPLAILSIAIIYTLTATI